MPAQNSPTASAEHKFAQRRGYFRALNSSWWVMIASLMIALLARRSELGQWLAMVIWTLGVCVTWPALEALSCEGESVATR